MFLDKLMDGFEKSERSISDRGVKVIEKRLMMQQRELRRITADISRGVTRQRSAFEVERTRLSELGTKMTRATERSKLVCKSSSANHARVEFERLSALHAKILHQRQRVLQCREVLRALQHDYAHLVEQSRMQDQRRNRISEITRRALERTREAVDESESEELALVRQMTVDSYLSPPSCAPVPRSDSFSSEQPATVSAAPYPHHNTPHRDCSLRDGGQNTDAQASRNDGNEGKMKHRSSGSEREVPHHEKPEVSLLFTVRQQGGAVSEVGLTLDTWGELSVALNSQQPEPLWLTSAREHRIRRTLGAAGIPVRCVTTGIHYEENKNL